MAKVKFNLRGFAALRTQPSIVAEVTRRIRAIEAASNAQSSWGGYESEVDVKPDRAVGRVWSISNAAKEDNARNQRLIRNLGAQ